MSADDEGQRDRQVSPDGLTRAPMKQEHSYQVLFSLCFSFCFVEHVSANTFSFRL